MTDLNPAQQAVAAGLLDLRDAAPRVDAETVARIRRGFTERTQWAVDALDTAGMPLWISKHAITSVLSCESRWHAGDDFSWTVANAVGSVVHRAAELMMVGRFVGTPLDAVYGAVQLISEENAEFAAFVHDGPASRAAAVRAQAVSHVTSLTHGFPPLSKRWLPRTEQWFQATLGGRTIQLNARPDLALGRPSGADARSVLIDLKTGGPQKSHIDDLRFYALVFMLRWGEPPWRIASYYAPDGTWAAEDVDADVLEAAALRTSDAILRMAEIMVSGRPPGVSPGPPCRWCALRETCSGPAELEEIVLGVAN